MHQLHEVFTVEPGQMLGEPALLLVRRDGHCVGFRRNADDMREWLTNFPQSEIEDHARATRQPDCPHCYSA